ncbi:cytochrome C class I [Candidatus Nitrosoglobus terrae]|uniref:Cytochrome C class I n=1 Tax=Candidatus Nitrosoglobus terrae TaxID=1630141 RepID=A0A1Q2SKI4_9GAMM|nr:c-type cytochrome [Candidatus Nitrosoglobus terrae]BAW79630.1 cytochrome C class I [Candidatus Nitrosoglobus terrae]
MMLKHFATITACVLFTTASNAALVEGNAKAGEAITVPCQNCHGPNGNSPNPEWPNLAGQNATYLKKQLQDFRSGARNSPIMSPMAVGLSDQDINNIAVYYASQKMNTGKTPEEYVELGKKLFQQGDKESGTPACMSCHGPSGSGNPAAAWPRLSGQNAEYMTSQLQAYRNNERANDPNMMMQGVTRKMSDKDITAISHYLSGLQIAH